MSKGWTFLSHHAHVLILMARNNEETLDNLAQQAGITTRSVTSVIKDLENAGYVSRSKVGRHNRYEINKNGLLRHPTSEQHTVGELIEALGELSS